MPRAILGGRAKLVVIWQELPIITASRLWSQQIGSTQNSLSELSVHPWPPHTHTHMDTHHTCTRMRTRTHAHTPATHAHIYAHIYAHIHARTGKPVRECKSNEFGAVESDCRCSKDSPTIDCEEVDAVVSRLCSKHNCIPSPVHIHPCVCIYLYVCFCACVFCHSCL